MSTGFTTRSYHDQSAQLRRLARKYAILLVSSLYIAMTKVLIRLHGCAGWLVPLLFSNPKDGPSLCKYLKTIWLLIVC